MHYLLSFEFRGGLTFVVRLTVFLRAFEISVAGQRLTENMYPKFIIVGVQATVCVRLHIINYPDTKTEISHRQPRSLRGEREAENFLFFLHS